MIPTPTGRHTHFHPDWNGIPNSVMITRNFLGINTTILIETHNNNFQTGDLK
jgi:hypothetical protein